MLKTLYFQWCNLNCNKIDVIWYLSKMMSFLLTCFRVHVTKISDKSAEAVNYSNLYWGPFFMGHSVSVILTVNLS